MRILRALAEKNLEARRAAWREKDQWHTIGGWTKAGVGSVVAAGGALYGVGGLLQQQGGNGQALVGFGVGGLGAGVLAWGVLDLLNPPPPPVPEWEVERKVVVKPPAGAGEQRVQVLQPAVAPARTDGGQSP
jgi:hypothetical protein